VDVSILDGANGRKFIASGPFDDEMPWHYLVIADISYWLKHEPEIYAWMDDNLPRGRLHQQGMTLEFETDEQLTLFVLRWA
jgi:hypothetical protein